MRTTLDIDDPILNELKKLQQRDRRSLGQLASSLLAQALKEHQQAESQCPTVTFEWNTASMGARVDLSDKEAVSRILDER